MKFYQMTITFFFFSSFPLSIIDTESKKCDATANFVVGSRPYLVRDIEPNKVM